jgi:hypothetical protein
VVGERLKRLAFAGDRAALVVAAPVVLADGQANGRKLFGVVAAGVQRFALLAEKFILFGNGGQVDVLKFLLAAVC